MMADTETTQVEKQERKEEKTTQEEQVVKNEKIIVTATRESDSLLESSVSADRIDGDKIDEIKPGHPAEVTNRIAGVVVNNLGGESHFTAIRNNLSTGANYLFLENGVPTRSTGFFNHNALYEINVPQASAVEIVKGPGTALYGSDAMHGVINVLTGEIPDEQLVKINGEAGSDGWLRSLLTYGDRINEQHAFRLDLNLTSSDGWRDHTDYSRGSFTAQHLWTPSADFSAKSVFTYSSVDQSLTSGLSEEDYKNNSKTNYYQISGRDVESFRFSTKFTKVLDDESEITFTPYYRNSYTYGLVPSWRLSSNPAPFASRGEVWDSGFKSYGALLKYKKDLETWNSRLIVGLDFDHSPGENKVEQTNLVRDFRPNGVYFLSSTRNGNVLYDYEATYTALSPYIHFETNPTDRLKLDFGLRYDNAQFDYENDLNGVADRIEDSTVHFEQFSPKFGFNYRYTEDDYFYGSIRRGFRAPSSGSLFSVPDSYDPLSLDPTTVDSFELGLKGMLTEKVYYDLAAYYMIKRDDIITFRDPSNPSIRTQSNNGKTEHYGVELTTIYDFAEDWSLRAVGSWSRHRYVNWDLGAAAFSGAPSGTELEGNELERAPRYTANFALNWHPAFLNGGHMEVETVILGPYETDSRNSDEYDGHELFNFRASYNVTDSLQLYGRVLNIADTLYSTNTSSSASTGYRPGAPRSFFGGFTYTF